MNRGLSDSSVNWPHINRHNYPLKSSNVKCSHVLFDSFQAVYLIKVSKNLVLNEIDTMLVVRKDVPTVLSCKCVL